MQAEYKTVVVIGAGPAGLTAALEFARHGGHRVIVLEELDCVGGISRTIEYKGNRMDIGGHRFFSKSDWVMQWWQQILPQAPALNPDGTTPVPEADDFMLVRSRLSRIYFLRRFFSYPITLSAATLRNLGLARILRIGCSYAWSRAFPRRPERNLEDFFYNRFGAELYRTFFKDYTEKVWGVPCREISPAWGAQRIKGLSVLAALRHAVVSRLRRRPADVRQKTTETSLIERFLYPKFGPGQMWQCVARQLRERGVAIEFGQRVSALHRQDGRLSAVESTAVDGTRRRWAADYVLSSMPVRDLVVAMEPPAPPEVLKVAQGLIYRDFITMGVLVRRLRSTAGGTGPLNLLPDTWIYIQEPDVRVGRLQVFNNWSPALVRDPQTVWLGLEYFCQEGDDLWSMGDAEFSRLAIGELARLDLVDPADVLDFHIVRVPKAYPAYFGTYDRFDVLRRWADGIGNLFLVGRNGMHRYNNQDHSMVTAHMAVEQIVSGKIDKDAIWKVNVEQEYHEEKPR